MPSEAFSAKPVEDHRADREAGAIVYPVYSRRSNGLSIGVNLFPDRKICSFDCPYCEVFPFGTDIRFSLQAMERGLRSAIAGAASEEMGVKDICFSGNGEPTLSPDLAAALEAASRLRDELASEAALVVITNGSMLGDPAVAGLLRRACATRGEGGFDLDLWVKLDAGSRSWYDAIDRGSPPFDTLIEGIEGFVASSRVTIQTMLCAVAGSPPPEEEEKAWLALALRLARTGNVRRFQLYGKARPAPRDPGAEALDVEYLEKRAAALRSALGGGELEVPVQVFP
jgi:histidinol dehydrogenase